MRFAGTPHGIHKSSEKDNVMDIIPIRQAILSVFKKEGIDNPGQALQAKGVHLLSTGGTGKALTAPGSIPEVSDSPAHRNARRAVKPSIQNPRRLLFKARGPAKWRKPKTRDPIHRLGRGKLIPLRRDIAGGMWTVDLAPKISISADRP